MRLPSRICPDLGNVCRCHGAAAVITQLANTIIRAIEQDRKVRELDEIEERLAELERRAADGHTRSAA